MRVLVKGGVWKNSEDEILKAAIMKYGKNQWPRVASLLPRKTAKQCKRRWNEWLDPMIKKTQWTREEDEKLLHYAKLMPTQWRTIAPLVGRTAGQCLERYTQLLDSAGRDGGEEDQEKGRRNKLDRLDTNPEDKPARPDPVDMDDDEKEMLSEAKARLANVNGKKAKRKAREKLLENARRMAKLQKYRELKAAGMSSHRMLLDRREKGALDYAAEIPFQRFVPTGFYSTEQEIEEGISRASSVESRKRLLEVANDDPNKRRKATEAALKRDREKFDKLAQDNLEQALKIIDERNGDLENSVRAKRIPLQLPEPQVSDQDMEIISKIGRKRQRSNRSSSSSSGAATQHLANDYSAQSAARRDMIRTPVAPDLVKEEARNQVARTKAQTPLVGGQAVATTEGTGFTGSAVTPSVRLAQSVTTATALAGAELGVRDHLGINKEEAEPASEALISRREAKAQENSRKAGLLAGLKSLPAPKYYQYEGNFVSKAPSEDLDVKDEQPRDARELEKLEQERKAAVEKHCLLNRTEVSKRGLPIPTEVPTNLTVNYSDATISEIWTQELRNVIEDDARDRERNRPSNINDAFALLREEAGKMFGDEYRNPNLEKFGKLLEAAHAAAHIAPSNVEAKVRKNKTKVIADGPFMLEQSNSGHSANARAFAFHTLSFRIEEAARQRKKLEDKACKKVWGLQQRAEKAIAEFEEAQTQLESAMRNKSTFMYMQSEELSAIPIRLQDWSDRVEQVEAREKELQQHYLDIM